MKTFESFKQLKKELDLNYKALDNYDLEKLKEFKEYKNDVNRFIIYENENELIQAIKDDLINNETLEYVEPWCLLDNLRINADLDADDIKNIQNISRGATKILQSIIDIDGVAFDILNLDGIGNFKNFITGQDIELTSKQNEKEYHVLTIE